MRIDLFDFFDGWIDDSIELVQVPVPDAEGFRKRVLVRTQAPKKHHRPLLRGLMIAAIVIALSITAVAVVGQYTIRQTEGMSYGIGNPHHPLELPEANFVINFENVPNGNVVGFRLNYRPALEQEYCVEEALSGYLAFLKEFHGAADTPEVPEDVLVHFEDEYRVGALNEGSRKDHILQAAEEWSAGMAQEMQSNARKAAEIYLNGEDMYAPEELDRMLAELFSPEELESLIAALNGASAESYGTACLLTAGIYSAADVKDTDFLCESPVEIVMEGQINGRNTLYFTSDDIRTGVVYQHILLYDAQLGCVFHIGGELSFEELERMVEGLELVEIDYPSVDYSPEYQYCLLDIRRG